MDAGHPATKLVEVFSRWAAEAPAGERTPKLHVDALDASGDQCGETVALTARQADRLAAALQGVDWCTDSALAIAGYLANWRAFDGEQPAVKIGLTDWRLTDDDLDDGATPAPILVPIAADRLDDLTAFLGESLDNLLMIRRFFLPRARWQEGKHLRVRAREGEKPFAAVGQTGVVTYVHVSMPRRPDEQPVFYYEVRLNVVDGGEYPLTLTEDELESAE